MPPQKVKAMALGKQQQNLERQLVFTIRLDDDEVDVAVDPNRTVGDVIQRALVHLDVAERASACHLAAVPGRFYLPAEPVAALEHDGHGAVLCLRLPQ